VVVGALQEEKDSPIGYCKSTIQSNFQGKRKQGNPCKKRVFCLLSVGSRVPSAALSQMDEIEGYDEDLGEALEDLQAFIIRIQKLPQDKRAFVRGISVFR
jgi:hypothetical protein